MGAVLEQLDVYKLVLLCLEERVGQLTGEVAVHVKEKQELQTHAMTIKNLWRTTQSNFSVLKWEKVLHHRILLLFHLKGSYTAIRFALC